MTRSYLITITWAVMLYAWATLDVAHAAAHSSATAAADRPDSEGSRAALPRGRHMIYPDQIRKAIQSYLERRFAGKVQEVHVTLGEPQQPIGVPPGTVALTVTSPDGSDSVGRRVFQVHVAVNGVVFRMIEATTEVAVYADMLTPVRLIKVDEEIEASDVTMIRLPLTDLKLPYATDPQEVVGKAAARPLTPQVPIRLNALRRPFVVRKGDRVMIEAKMGGLSIQTAGVTKGNGELGQTVTVSNTDSGKDVRGKVVGPGVVRVDF
ncbi:MAG TPA: flagellar basal body P-ring formation chaperone FlgA [Nitrospiraceae bacterium]|nr:flagellar basal body P-ring formation chaperone FlgA [Nitrospiraceae bacterium]